MDIRPLKTILSIEGALGVARSYQKFRKLKLLYAITIIILMLFVINNILFMCTKGKSLNYLLTYAHWCLSLQTIFSIVWTMLKSKQHDKLLGHLHETHMSVKLCWKYKELKYLHIMITISAVLYVLITFIFTSVKPGNYYDASSATEFHTNWLVFVLIKMAILRIMIQNLTYYSLITILSHQLDFIRHAAEEAGNRFIELKHNDGSRPSCNFYLDTLTIGDVERSAVSAWCEAYISTHESCSIINAIFKLPMTIHISCSTLFYIILFYIFITDSVHEGVDWGHLFSYGAMSIPNVQAVLMFSRAGQRVQNNYVLIKRALAALLVAAEPGSENYSTMRNMIRVVSSRPIQLEMFGSVRVGNSLLPTVFVYFTSYLIVALQYNNVV